MSYYTRSGRESRAPDRFGATASQGVGEGGTSSQHTATDRNPSQGRQGDVSPIRNTETLRRYSPPWTDEMNRSFIEGLRASRYRREEDARQGSGAMPMSSTPVEQAEEWSVNDGDLFMEELHRARARRLAGENTGPANGEGLAGGSGGSEGSVAVQEEVNRPSRDSTPNPQSQGNDSISNEASTGGSETEGASKNTRSRTGSDSPEVVTGSGRPVEVPQWMLEEIRRTQQAREREESIISQFPEGPAASMNVGGSPEEFKIKSIDIDEKGSPQYRYGIATPDQRPLPTVYVRGTPEGDERPRRTGQATGGTIPKPPPVSKMTKRAEAARNPAVPERTTATGWRAGLKPVELLVRSVVDSMKGGRAQTSSKAKEDVAPPPPPKGPRFLKSQRYQSEDEYGITTDTERFLRDYKTPPKEGVDLHPEKSPRRGSRASETSASEIDMEDRIPAEKKGKGRARFATPIVQPDPMLQDARKAEVERRKRLQKELEEKARRQEEERIRMEKERIRMEDEWYETQHQLAVLASEQTAMEEAEKLEQSVLHDESDQTVSDKATSTQEKSDAETTSASEHSGKENSARETNAPTTTDTESKRTPLPNPKKKKSVGTPIDYAKIEREMRERERKDAERHERRKKESEKKGRKDEPGKQGEPHDSAMRTAQLVSEMKEAIKDIVMEQMEGMRQQVQPVQRAYSPLSWRTSGFQRGKSLTASTLGDATTTSRSYSMRRSATLAESPESSEKDTSEEEEKPKKKRESVEEREKKERKAAMKALKVGQPDPWSGKPVYDKFDRWVDQVDEWQRNHELSEYAVIATMGFLLTGSAKDWFKDYVRDKEREWTLEELNSALFEEMFPPNIDSTLRETFERAEQGTSSLKKWHKFVTKLALRVTNLSEHDVRRRFMTGANTWLREKWAEMGYGPEDTTITMQALMESGLRFERARAIYTGEKQKTLSKSKGPASGGTWNKDQKAHKNGGTKPQEKGGGGYQKQGQEAKKQQDSSNPGGGRTYQKKELTEKEKAELRAADRCFECKDTGHTARNCPKRREVSPTHKGKGKKTIYNASLRFEAMKTKPGGPTIRLNMIEPLAANGVIASERRRKEEAVRTHQLQEERESIGLIGRILHTHLVRQLGEVRPDYEWQRHSPLRLNRFKVESESEGVFSVHDTWDGWRTHLEAKKIFDPSFKIGQWVKEMKKTAPLFFDLNEPGATVPNEESSSGTGETDESSEESSAESDEDSDESYEEISLDFGRKSSKESSGSDDDLPDLEEVSDLTDDEDDPTSEENSENEGESTSGTESTSGGGSGSESESAKLWRRLRSRWRSSVAPEAFPNWESDSDSGEENLPSANPPHPIRCAMAQTTTKPRGKPKPRDSKSKKKLWESLEDNSASAKDDDRVMPHPIILTVYVNGRACRALLDSGAFSDFISTTLVDNLGLKRQTLSQAMTLQMAVQGSRSKINARTTVDFAYSTIKCPKTFDIINIANYDMILGTPFFWQHKILAGMNPTRIAIGTDDPLPITGEDVHTILGAMSIQKEESLQDIRDMLAAEAKDLCEDAATSALPPFRAINHHIPLIDDSKVYKYRPSKCPRALEPMWREKSGEYLRTGRWRVATGTNPIPLLLIQKPRKTPDDPIKLRACFDKREQNANTRKLASPLPDQTEVLERIASHKYRSVIDGRDAYEQIRIEKDDVWKTLFNSPSGTMESLVLQQGDCNGPATYQSLMNHIFGSYIGVWMDVYLDDIMIYSNSLKEHIKHVRIVFKILREQKLFLNPKKMQFLAPELQVLGHRITDEGIKMDPHKVDSIAKWPTPTNKDLLSQFIGAVGYLADGVRGIRIPMAVLNKLVGSKKIFRWGATEQRAFEQTKALVQDYCQKTRVPLSYKKGAPRIWLVTDASMTGAAGHVCQGDDWKTAKPVAFWSGKFSSAEQAYRTHEQELLAIIESLKRFRHHLLGTKFTIVTDHERLESFMTQKDLTRRQARWLETLSDFDFDVKWTPGKSNIFADALSRIYSNDAKGTERAFSEQVTAGDEDDEEGSPLGLFSVEASECPSRPIVVGDHIEAEMVTLMAAQVRRNPGRGKGKHNDLQKSEAYSEDSEDSESSASEARETRGGGKSRNSVPREPINPQDSPRVGQTSVVPAASKPAGKAAPAPYPAKSTKRSKIETDEDGESEMESSREHEPKKTSKKKEFEAMMANRNAKKAPISQPRNSLNNSENDQETVKGKSNTLKRSKELNEVEQRQSEAREELIQANADLEEGCLPHPDEDSGSTERAMDVRLTDIIKDVEFPHDLEGRYAEDDFFKVVLKDPLHYTNFDVVGEKGKELVYMKDSQQKILCIPNVSIGSRRAREIVITHAHSILAHLGARKTLWYLRENVWWKEMIKDITDYCTSCDVCARTKATNQKPMGLLHPLKVPTRPWEQIGVDFVGPLPEAKNCYGAFDQVMVVIDHLTSMVHLIPAKINYRARQIAEIFYDTIYKLHGLPERIISDRDKIFTSIFWQNLHRLMRVNLKLSSTYHPQTDGATERANRTMVQMIRQAIGAKDSRWLERLPAIEWAMNAARSETTGFSPFFLNYGYRPRPLLWNNASKDEYPGVHAFAQRMKDTILTAHDAILEKRVKQTRLANKGRRPAPFIEGDSVYLSTKNVKLPKGKTRKLVPKYIGPYKITKVLVPGTSYRLELPDDLRSRGIHNAFHASLLRLYVPNCDTRFPGRQVEQLAAFGEADEDWEVSRIKGHNGTGEDALFELEWTNGDVTWEPLYRVRELEAMTEYLEAMGVTDVRYLKKGKGQPPSDDPETFIGMLMPTETVPEKDIKAEEGDDEESLTPTLIIPQISFPIPTPPSIPSLVIMQQSNRRFDPRKSNPNPRPALRTRMGTPYPDPSPAKLASTSHHFRNGSNDALDVATAVAAASTTPELAKEIRDNVARLSGTAAKRAQLYKDVKESPALFFNKIGMRNMADRTWHEVERSFEGPVRTRASRNERVTFEIPPKAPRAPKPPKAAKSAGTPTAPKAMRKNNQNSENNNQIASLVSLVKDLIATTTFNNALAAANMEPMLDIPPFLPKITPAPLPNIQPNSVFEFDSFINQDTDMNNVETNAIEGEAIQEEVAGNIEEEFEQVTGEEAVFVEGSA